MLTLSDSARSLRRPVPFSAPALGQMHGFNHLPSRDVGASSGAAAAAAAAAAASAQAAASAAQQQLGQVLDLLDYGLVLLAADGQVQHLNQAARRELAEAHPLQLQGRHLVAAASADAPAWRDALHQAASRGLRKLLTLGPGTQRCSLAVVPLPRADGASQHGVAVLMARRRVCEQLTVESFARSHGLTMAETTVVKGLCADLTPQQIADQQGVGLATVRTQIGAVRMKTGASSIGALIRQVSLLPPLVGVLQGLSGAVSGALSDNPAGRAAVSVRPQALHA